MRTPTCTTTIVQRMARAGPSAGERMAMFFPALCGFVAPQMTAGKSSVGAKSDTRKIRTALCVNIQVCMPLTKEYTPPFMVSACARASA